MSQPERKLSSLEKINRFFKNPALPYEFNDRLAELSTLYVLRRDASKCYGINPESPDDPEITSHMALFPGAMTVFCGIDLLAKFYRGDSNGEVAKRFKEYVKDFFPSASTIVDLPLHLWNLRNCLIHSFGMRDKKKRANGEFTYGIKADLNGLDTDFVVELKKNEWYVIDILTLREEFEASVSCFEAYIHGSEAASQQCCNMWDRYGSMTFSGLMLSTDEFGNSSFLYPGYSMLWAL